MLQIQREWEYLESMGLDSILINLNNITFNKSALELALEFQTLAPNF